MHWELLRAACLVDEVGDHRHRLGFAGPGEKTQRTADAMCSVLHGKRASATSGIQSIAEDVSKTMMYTLLHDFKQQSFKALRVYFVIYFAHSPSMQSF